MIEPRPEPLYMSGPEMRFHHIHFETTCDPCKLTGFHRCDLITNHTILCSQSHLFPSQWDSFTKTQHPNKFQGLFEEINQIAGKWETNFATFYKPAHYIGSIKYLYSRKNSCIERLKFVIQNRCDKVVIELRLLQLWTEIVMILVIWNQTCAARSFDL